MFGLSHMSYPFTNNHSQNQNHHSNPHNSNSSDAQMNGMQTEGMTPGARSNGESVGTTGTEEKDPFLSLLEQLAENEHSRGGPSELDYYLGGGGA